MMESIKTRDGWNDWDSDYDGMDDRAVDLTNTPRFVMELFNRDSNGNVVQGLGVDLERRGCLGYLKIAEVIPRTFWSIAFHWKRDTHNTVKNMVEAKFLGHGQDLILEYTKFWFENALDRFGE